ncbi:MAG: cold shock domain-containing protein [Dokdonella sp.]
MRTHGTLTKWNDDRGFGFLSPTQGTREVFVHISAFPRDGTRPVLNELVSYETETPSGGKLRAVRIMHAGVKSAPHRAAARVHRRTGGLAETLLGILAICAVGWYFFVRNESLVVPTNQPSSAITVETADRAIPSNGSSFECDGRTMCSQMSSCAEAQFFIDHCPGTKMDGDGDRVPCEQQWCNGQ